MYLHTKTGSKQADGSWDGMIGDLLSGRADIAVSSLTINQVAVSSSSSLTAEFRKGSGSSTSRSRS